MKTLGNIVWLVFGGFFLFLHYLFSGFLLCLTIIGIPFGLQLFKMADIALWPFEKDVIHINSGNESVSLIMNIIWLIFGGFSIALHHFFWGLFFSITIIGIPFGIQHFKMAKLAVFPFGNSIK